MNLVVVSKRKFFQALLFKGAVYVHVAPRRGGVRVPTAFENHAKLVLCFGYELPNPTNDVAVDASGISATLSFDQTPHKVSIAWSAIYAITDEKGDGTLWEDDMPPEVSLQTATIPQAPKTTERPRLGVINGDAKRPIARSRPRNQ